MVIITSGGVGKRTSIYKMHKYLRASCEGKYNLKRPHKIQEYEIVCQTASPDKIKACLEDNNISLQESMKKE